MPIISGLVSGLDTESIVNQIAAVNKVPITRIEGKKTQINDKLGSWQAFSLKMLDLKVNATALSSRLSAGARAVTSSLPDALKTTVNGTPEIGTYAVKVKRLAQGELSLSQGVAAVDSPVVTSGTLTVKAGNGTDDRDVSGATALAFLNNGTGVALGSIQVTDRSGASATIDLSTATTIQDVIDLISGHPSVKLTAVINDKGHGLKIIDDTASTNSNLIIEEVGGGQTAGQLGLLTAVGGVTASSFSGTDLDPLYSLTLNNTNNTLEGIRDALNGMGGPFSAAIINEGTGANPYHLSISSKNSGVIGALAINATTVPGGVFAFSETQSAQDAEVELGTTNPLTIFSHTNQVSNAIPGISLTLINPTAEAAQISVNPEVESLVSAVKDFIGVYNALANDVHKENQYNADTKTPGGPLFGDVTLQNMLRDITRNLTDSVKGLPSTASSIFQIGIEPGPSGTLKVNESVLTNQLTNNFEAVKAIFTQKTNSAKEATQSASSTTAGYSLADLSDGESASTDFGPTPAKGWMGANAGGGETLEWVFAQPRYLGHATISTVDSPSLPAAAWGVRDYDLQALKVGGNPGVAEDWITLASVRNNQKGSVSHNFSAYTSRIRMVITGTNASDGLARLTEVQLDESTGIAARLNNVLSTLTNSSTGTVFGVQDALSAQVKTMDAEIARLNDRLSKQMAFLSKQFAQMESALAQLQRSGSYLSAFTGTTATSVSNGTQS